MKKNGFTFIEIMVVVAIIGILATIGTLSLSGRGEKSAVAEVKSRVPAILGNAINRSFDSGQKLKIEFRLPDTIIVKDSNNVVIDNIRLPKNLKYDIVDDNALNLGNSLDIELNETGGFVNPSTGSLPVNLRVRNKLDGFQLRLRLRNIAGTGVGILEVYTGGFNSNPTQRI